MSANDHPRTGVPHESVGSASLYVSRGMFLVNNCSSVSGIQLWGMPVDKHADVADVQRRTFDNVAIHDNGVWLMFGGGC